MKLTRATLNAIAETTAVAVPQYDRSGLTAGIVHFGVGNFHRAHQAVVMDDLFAEGKSQEFAICGVGVLPGDTRMRDVLVSQDGLYVLQLRHADGARESRVVGSIVDYLYAPDDPETVIARLASSSTRIASLTVTEGGYNFDPVTGEFNSSHPDVQHDIAQPSHPRTVFGLIVAALRRIRDSGTVPFTVMSCDNLPGNGTIARVMFVSFARLSDGDLARWIDENVPFPNSMVDRITPVTTPQDSLRMRVELGIDDAWPVAAEPFFQWVLEDRFSRGRPAFEQAGVQLVDDVEPYELMKLRLLNASHQAMAYFGYLAGYKYVDEAMADDDLRAFVRRFMDLEATPTLEPVPGVDLELYKDTLIERFSNTSIKDTLARLAADSSDRIPKWLVPVIRENLAAGREVELSAAICASWARYAEGTDEEGRPISVVDRLRDDRVQAARRQHLDELAFLRSPELFADLPHHGAFVDAYTASLRSLHMHGAKRTYRRLAQGSEL